MWDNEDWAAGHLKKRHPGVTTKEAWEIVFGENKATPLRSPDQLRYPPFFRYWTIGTTKKGVTLLVVWEVHRTIFNLVTAFPPDKERIERYEKLKKNKNKR